MDVKTTPHNTRVVLIPQEGLCGAVPLPLHDAMRLESIRNFASDMDLPYNGGAAVDACCGGAVVPEDIHFPTPMVTANDLSWALPLLLPHGGSDGAGKTVEDIVDDDGVEMLLRLMRIADYLGSPEFLACCETWLASVLVNGPMKQRDALMCALFPSLDHNRISARMARLETEQAHEEEHGSYVVEMILLQEAIAEEANCCDTTSGWVCKGDPASEESNKEDAEMVETVEATSEVANDAGLCSDMPLGLLQKVLSRLSWKDYDRLSRLYPELEAVWGSEIGGIGGDDPVALARRFPDTTTICYRSQRGYPPNDEKLLEAHSLLRRVHTLQCNATKPVITLLSRLDVERRHQIRNLEIVSCDQDAFGDALRLFPNLRSLTCCGNMSLDVVAKHNMEQLARGGEDAEWCREVTLKGAFSRAFFAFPVPEQHLAAWPTINGMTPTEYVLSQGSLLGFEHLVPARERNETLLLAVAEATTQWKITDALGDMRRLQLCCRLLKWLGDTDVPEGRDSPLVTTNEHRKTSQAKRDSLLYRQASATVHNLQAAAPADKPQYMELLVLLCGFMSTSTCVQHLFEHWTDARTFGTSTPQPLLDAYTTLRNELELPPRLSFGRIPLLPWLYLAEKKCRGVYPLTLACLTGRFTVPVGQRLRSGCTVWHCLTSDRLEHFVALFDKLPANEQALIPSPCDVNDYGQTPLMTGLIWLHNAPTSNRLLSRWYTPETLDTMLAAVDHSGKSTLHHFFRIALEKKWYHQDTPTWCEEQLFKRCHAIRDHSGRTPLQMLLNPPDSERLTTVRWQTVAHMVTKLFRIVPDAGRDTVDVLLDFLAGGGNDTTIFMRLLLRAGRCVQTWCDAGGNNLAHRAVADVLNPHRLLSWLALAGVSLSAPNHANQTPLDMLNARQPLKRTPDFSPTGVAFESLSHVVEVFETHLPVPSDVVASWWQHNPIAQGEVDNLYKLVLGTPRFDLHDVIVQPLHRCMECHRTSRSSRRFDALQQFLSDLGTSPTPS